MTRHASAGLHLLPALAAISLLACLPALGQAQPAGPAASIPAAADTPYAGTLELDVDATDLDRKIFRVKERLPVQAGPLTLFYPRWLPGEHAPGGPISRLAGLTMSLAGKPVAWQRDPLDDYAFHVELPADAANAPLELDYQFLSATRRDNDRMVMTPEMVGLQWRSVVLYPAGHWASRIRVQPSLRLPEGWHYGTALESASGTPNTADRGGKIAFKPVSLEALVDSPVFAGHHMQRIDLDPDARGAGRAPIYLDVMADDDAQLVMTPEALAAHRALVAQADRLYGARHYAHYDMLLAISAQFGGIGLEHHQSSENGVRLGYFTEWAKAPVGRDLLAHEYTHSWNGKFRRPADLWTPNFNTPMQDSLLWVYEGQTEFWGQVLAARSGLVPQADARDEIASLAAWLDATSGRRWRNLQDTTQEPIIGVNGRDSDWYDYSRGTDYYDEMVLVWLEADMLIRERSGNQRSLDDFARAFLGPQAGRAEADWSPLTYTFSDVVAALNRVQPYDWAAFLRERLDSHGPRAPLAGLEHSGWRLAWDEKPTEHDKAAAERRHEDDFGYSIGFTVNTKDQAISFVRWDSPAFNAGLSTAATLVAVNGLEYKSERLAAAITAAKASKAPILLLVKEGEAYRTVAVNCTIGLRYPKLERIPGTEDRLALVLAPRN
jgi:predicted metalloprotease with PDZ domain